ncbi:hypothetical protein [Nonlabens marinus]|uniref:Uncharacterized protein n=1 Tax=Nonlabens marinus S1-08 TaxID=1454201 RepID=W8VZ72_9FLAO|nr:hypothetical protein [Nonlabens marinus]BAO54071.1 hypothetical protein NMS_0062 [Nonlabens marinus S1-08]
MINTNDLNEYSNKVYAYLIKKHSNLVENISIHPSDFGKNHLRLEIKSINENSTHNLFLSSEDNEFTIGFDIYHDHFDSFSSQDFDSEIKVAMDYFNKILSDVLLVICAGGSASTLLTNEGIKVLESGQILDSFNYDCITYYVVSWSGHHDRTFENPKLK